MPLKLLPIKPKRSGTYNKRKGFYADGRAYCGRRISVKGTVPPATDNLAFIKQCQQSLPEGCAVGALRIDAAGYQTKIIE